MEKALKWSALYEKIGKQPFCETQNANVQVLIDGTLQDCELVFGEDGQGLYLRPVSVKSRFTDGMQVTKDGDDADDIVRCPYCNAEIGTNDDLDYFGRPTHCEHCGTKLIWTAEDPGTSMP